jgi:hypothetical protein
MSLRWAYLKLEGGESKASIEKYIW